MIKIKKFFAVVGLISLSLSAGTLWATELCGQDLKAVNLVLDSKLYINNFEKTEEKLNYLQEVENQIEMISSEISEEANLICKNILIVQKQTAIFNPQDLEVHQSKKNQKEENPELKKIAMDLYNSYKDFYETHEAVSSHFMFHYKEAEFNILPYLTTKQQIKVFKTLIDYYKDIEKQNPEYSENLSSLGMMLYFMPGIMGGSKKEGEEKLIKAYKTASCNYEKATAGMMVSQIMLERKNSEEAFIYLEEIQALAPENKMIKQIKDLNEKGYSMFSIDEYEKDLEKEAKKKKNKN